MPKSKNKSLGKLRHAPLGQELERDMLHTAVPNKNKKSRRKNAGKKDEDETDVLPEDLSRKVLAQARQQQLELEESDSDDNHQATARHVSATRRQQNRSVLNTGKGRPIDLSDDDDDVDDKLADYEDEESIEIDADDEAALALFMPSAQPQRQTLADIIMEKIRQFEQNVTPADVNQQMQRRLNPKVYKVYKGVGQFLASYKTGKLPKAFKVVPRLSNWEEILWVMEPHAWSPQAMWAATRLFASNLNPKMAQRYFALVLLPRIREEIQMNRKLTFSVYQALRKATYKPGAFFKGIVLPLAEDGATSWREAMIVGSVVRRASLPVLHSAAALMKLAEMPYTTASAIFLKFLLDKKYALPFKTVDAVYSHFVSFTRESRRLPVLWHQCLLVFAQRYKTDLEPEQKEGMKPLLRAHEHRAITPEVRRELFSSLCRHGAPPVADDLPPDALTDAQRLALQIQQQQQQQHGAMDAD